MIMAYTTIKLTREDDDNIIRLLEKNKDSNISFLLSDGVNKLLENWHEGFTAKNLLTIFKEFAALDEELLKKSKKEYWLTQEGIKETESNMMLVNQFIAGSKQKKEQLDELKVAMIKVTEKF